MESPAIFYRSDIIKFSTKLELSIKENHTITIFWTIYALDNNDTIIEPDVKLEGNPTVNYTELVIRSNTLTYNKYKLKQDIMVKIDTGDLKNVDNFLQYTAEAYIVVVPGGIAPYSFENGLDHLTIGTNQSLTLNPLKYAYDMDFLASTDSLHFDFYCFVVNKNYSVQNKSNLENFQNLAKFNDGNETSNECFDNRDKLLFESNNRILTIKPNGLKYNKNISYLFLVNTFHMEKEYYHIIRVDVLDFTKIPIVSSR